MQGFNKRCPQHKPKSRLVERAQESLIQGTIPAEVYRAYRAHAGNSRRRGVSFEFTIEQWWSWWQIEKRWARRGVGAGMLVMARIGDKGPYHPDNVKCIEHQENCSETDGSKAATKNRSRWAAMPKAERAKWHLAVRGDGHPKSRAVITPDGRFGSAALAAEAYGLTRHGAAYRARSRLDGWRYETD